MKIDDICSPGMVPNAHRLRQETIRAIAFCETLKSSEKAVELQGYFREAIAYLDRELVSKDLPESEKPIIDENAVSPFYEDEFNDPSIQGMEAGDVQGTEHPAPTPAAPEAKKTVGKPAVKGKK